MIIRQVYNHEYASIVETGEQKTFSSINKAEKVFGFREARLRDRTRGNRCYIENGWEFRRGD